jgi:hypothetical protein
MATYLFYEVIYQQPQTISGIDLMKNDIRGINIAMNIIIHKHIQYL